MALGIKDYKNEIRGEKEHPQDQRQCVFNFLLDINKYFGRSICVNMRLYKGEN